MSTTLKLCLALAALAYGTGAQAQPIPRAPAFARDALVAPPTENWPTNGGNWYNHRYSPLTADQPRQRRARSKACGARSSSGSGVGTKYSGEAQPLVYDGVIYVVTGADDVFAISVESGEILWSYAANLDAANDVVCCGWTSRGVGLGDGKVFVGQLDGKLVALDQRTGKVAWSVQAERWQEGFTITSAPLYYDGLVITGFAGGEYGIRGRVKAFDANDGKLVWTFYTIPGPGEVGHDTWPQDNELWQHGGASVWQTPAVDPELGLIYFSTGNPGPDFNGVARNGDNLFSASIVAVDAKTGEVPLALPAGASRHLGLRRPEPRRAVRPRATAVSAEGLAQAEQDGLGLHPRPHERHSRSSASTSGPCRRSRGRRRRRRSPTRAATRSCRSRSTSRPKATRS